MNHTITRQQQLLFIATVGFTVYWFANAVLWIPWVLSRWVGIIIMILLTPCLWGLASWACFRYSPVQEWQTLRWWIAGVFLVIATLSDYVFFAIWRGIPEELYHPTTFAAYGLIVIMPFVTRRFLVTTRKTEPVASFSPSITLKIGIGGLLSVLITLYSVRFW